MSKRKSISKKLRFEVFKRDGFTCGNWTDFKEAFDDWIGGE